MIITIIALFLPLFYAIYYFSFSLPKRERISFRLYELRDEVAMEVVKGNLSDEDIEYVVMINLINIQIGFLHKEIPYTEMFTSSVNGSDEQVDLLLSLIYQDEFLKKIYEEVIQIYKRTFRFKKYIFKYMYVLPISASVSFGLWRLGRKRNIAHKSKKSEAREICRYRENATQSFGFIEKIVGSGTTYML